ncbi:MAG: DUF4175 family protein, partial [Gemmatimonadales bacterium]
MHRARLSAVLGAMRRSWRGRVLARGGVTAVALFSGVVLLLGGLGGLGRFDPSVHSALRWLPLLVALGALVAAAWRALFRAPSLEALALRLDEVGTHDHLPLTLLHLEADHPYAGELARRMDARLDGLRPGSLVQPVVSLREGAGATLLAALAALFLVGGGGPGAVWSAWGEAEAEADRLAQLQGQDTPSEDPFQELRLRIEPPAYTGLEPVEYPAREGVTALAGSRVHLTGGRAAARAHLEARVIREGQEPESLAATGSWGVAWTLAQGDRGLLVRDAGGRERILPIQVLVDDPPEVELLEPIRDLVLARGEGRVTIRARARDPHGIHDFRLSWVHTRGGGESFDFREESREWSRIQETEQGIEGTLTLELEEVGLGAGEVLHLRATASDVNQVTGPGTGVSRTRQIRVIREGEEMQVDALLGFPLEVDAEPVLSQRMLLIMTQELLERAPELTQDELARESGAIARRQLRLREQVGEQVFSRATGAMQPGDAHLGDHSHGDDAHEIAELLGHDHGHDHGHDPDRGHDHDHDHDHAHDHAHDHRADAGADTLSVTAGSRYGVASIFDPSAREPEPEPRTGGHGHTHAGVRPGEAGTDVGRVTV